MALKVKATGGDGRTADLDMVRRALSVLADPEAGCQLQRAPFHAESFCTFKGDDLDGMVAWVEANADALGIYYALNPVPADLNRQVTSKDVLRRRWLLIDVDRDKTEAKDHPATDEEHERARLYALRLKAILAGYGWPEPILIDSGNGLHLLYRIDLPNPPERANLSQQLLKAFLDALAFRHPSPDGLIGTECHDARRIAKMPGTWARKGTPSALRPWRMARLVEVPAFIEVVQPELIRDTIADLRSRSTAETVVDVVLPEANGHGNLKVLATASGPSVEDRARLYLARIPGAVSGRGGHNQTFDAARCMVYGFDLGVEAGLHLLLADYNPRCDPPWTERELRHKCEDADTREYGKPRGWLVEDDSAPYVPPVAPAKPALAPGEPLTVSLAAVTPKKIDWLVPNRIPLRFITIFAGRTGVGKSFVALDLVARLTTAGAIPCLEGQRFGHGNVLLISEDSHEYVLAPRLIAAGADLQRVRAMSWKAMATYDLADTPMLERACGEMIDGVRLIVIDPPTNFLIKADEHKNAEVRQVVMKIVEWLQDKDVAVLFILHVNKNCGKGVEALNRVMGSVAWVTTSRIAHSFTPDPDDRTRCLFIPMKNNLGPVGKGLAYRIVESGEMGLLKWIGEVDTTADEAMAGDSKGRSRKVVAAEWLLERFREKLEWASNDLFRAADAEGISRSAVFDAKRMLALPKARQVIEENGNRTWVWWVPCDFPALVQQVSSSESVEPVNQCDTKPVPGNDLPTGSTDW